MRDRTHVTLSVLATQTKAAQHIFSPQYREIEPETAPYDPHTVYFDFEEINYGDLKFLPKLLAAGIAYTSYWGNGSEYGEGTEYGRFTEFGEAEVKRVFDAEINPNLAHLLDLIDKPKELRDLILEHKDNSTPLPWDHQEEYGKRYRVMRLVT